MLLYVIYVLPNLITSYFISLETAVIRSSCLRSLDHWFDNRFEVIEEYLENKDYIMKEGFGICDIFLISCLDWSIFYEFELTKNMTKYRDDIINRPAYKKAMDINYSR